MKTAADYKSADEILRDPELDGPGAGYKRGKMIDEFRRLHPEQPAPAPTPTADERRQFGDLRTSLSSARNELLALDEKEKRISVWLPSAQEELRRLETETPPDATAEVLDEINRLARRIQLARTFDGNVGSAHLAIKNRVCAALYALNKLFQRYSTGRFPIRFFLSGVSPIPVINEALNAIEIILG